MLRAAEELGRVLDEELAAGAFPGAQLLVAVRGSVAFLRSVGVRGEEPEDLGGAVSDDTAFDLASLTKVLCTTLLAMREVDAGRLDLEARVADLVPELLGAEPDTRRAAIRVRHLLEHSAGFPAWRPYYADVGAAAGEPPAAADSAWRRAILERALTEPLEAAPGERVLYSDIGFLVLAAVLERGAGGRGLAERFRSEIAAPLGSGAGFRPAAEVRAPAERRRFAASERCPWRGRVLVGEVHDDNAWAMGGDAPQAGLFGTAEDVQAIAGELTALACARGPALGLVRPETVRRFWQRGEGVASGRGLGWDAPAAAGSSAGRRFGSASVGHLGFTGTSLWIDPQRDLSVVLLTNRVHPSRANERIREARPRLHEAAAALAD